MKSPMMMLKNAVIYRKVSAPDWAAWPSTLTAVYGPLSSPINRPDIASPPIADRYAAMSRPVVTAPHPSARTGSRCSRMTDGEKPVNQTRCRASYWVGTWISNRAPSRWTRMVSVRPCGAWPEGDCAGGMGLLA